MPQQGKVDLQHRRLGREIQQQLAGLETQLRGEPVLDTLDQSGVTRDPIAPAARHLGGTHVERAFEQLSAPQPGGQVRVAHVPHRLHEALVGAARNPVGLEIAARHCGAHQALEHGGRAAHGVMPVHVAVHLVLREQQ